VDAAHRLGERLCVKHVASNELGVARRAVGERLESARKAAHPKVGAGLQAAQEAPADVPAGSGQKDDPSYDVADASRISRDRRQVIHDDRSYYPVS
jgi:hypothetical protein